MRRLMISLTALLLLAGTWVVWRVPNYTLAAGETEGAVFYNALIESGFNGNTEARDALDLFATFAAERGQRPEELAITGTRSRAMEMVGGGQIRREGFPPFWLRIDNVTDITDPTDLRRYIAMRDEALRHLATNAPGREIEVQVAFASAPTLAAVLDFASAQDATVDQLHVEAVVGGERMFTHVIAEDAAARLAGAGATEVEAMLQSLITEAAIPTCGHAPHEISWQPSLLRLTMTAANALAARSRPDVAAVDPLADILDHYGDQAASVTVGDWPRVDQQLTHIPEVSRC